MIRKGNEYIINVVYYFFKWKEVYVVLNYIVMIVVDKLLIEFICCYGILCQIYIYQGWEFESELFIVLCEKLGIEKIVLNCIVFNLMDLLIGLIVF